jgi:hypothetical protein
VSGSEGLSWCAVRERVAALELPADHFVLFGSAPLLAYGLIAEVGDIDLLAVGPAWARAAALASPTRAPGGDQWVRLADGVEVYGGWLGLDVAAIIRRAERKDGLLVAHLGDVARYKRLLDRPKDRVHLELLEPYLARFTS